MTRRGRAKGGNLKKQHWLLLGAVGGDATGFHLFRSIPGLCTLHSRSIVDAANPPGLNYMASRIGRLARFTLYSGPNCSLCDVSAGIIVIKAAI